MRIWTCKIGVEDDIDLPDGADQHMRREAKQAFYSVAGGDPDFCFSGWGGELDEVELEVVRLKRQTKELHQELQTQGLWSLNETRTIGRDLMIEDLVKLLPDGQFEATQVHELYNPSDRMQRRRSWYWSVRRTS